MAIAILAMPCLRRYSTKGRSFIEKGALIVNECDELCRKVPGVRRWFYLVERRGWSGLNHQATADVKLCDDASTMEEARRLCPHSIVLEYSNADFVDTDKFRPLGTPKRYDGIQISAWKKFKRHELFVHAVALLPEKKFIKFGHLWDERSWSARRKQRKLREETIRMSHQIAPNIEYPSILPATSEAVNALINEARIGILTTTLEGVNRFKMECLAADLPFLVPVDASGPTKKHLNDKTGLLFGPTPEALADAIRRIERDRGQFAPREYLLSHSGIHIATAILKEALEGLARRDRQGQVDHHDPEPAEKGIFDEIYWDGRNQSMIWGWRGVWKIRWAICRMQWKRWLGNRLR